jgi:hypothetical protein
MFGFNELNDRATFIAHVLSFVFVLGNWRSKVSVFTAEQVSPII